MMISCGFICVFLMLINKVSLQVTVEAVIGGSVVLPCSTKHLKPEDLHVFWRYSGSKIVYDIIPSSDSQEKQDPEYKNRTEIFPEEYKKGNFSIKLKDLTHTDAGEYICFIAHSSEHQTVQLIMNESTSEKVIISTEQENQGETEPGSDGTSSTWHWVGIVSIVTVIVIIVFIVAWRIKRNLSSLRADRHDMGSGTPEVESIMNHKV